MKALSISKEVRAELTAVQRRIGEIESEIEALDEERFRLQSAPVSKSEALALVDDELELLAREGRARLHAAIRSAGRGNRPDIYSVFEKPTSQGRETDTKVLVAILGSAIREVVTDMVNHSEAFSDDSFTAAEREKQLAAVDKKIAALEGERQNLIDELRQAGFDVTDADEVEGVSA